MPLTGIADLFITIMKEIRGVSYVYDSAIIYRGMTYNHYGRDFSTTIPLLSRYMLAAMWNRSPIEREHWSGKLRIS